MAEFSRPGRPGKMRNWLLVIADSLCRDSAAEKNAELVIGS